jgi:hypothetical protein
MDAEADQYHPDWVYELSAFIEDCFGQKPGMNTSQLDGLAIALSILQGRKDDFDLVVVNADKELLIMQLAAFFIGEINLRLAHGCGQEHVTRENIEAHLAKLRYMRVQQLAQDQDRKT